jgi:serine/threonine protein kinase
LESNNEYDDDTEDVGLSIDDESFANNKNNLLDNLYKTEKFSSVSCDNWSIGMTLHIWLTGKFPFELNSNDTIPSIFNGIKNKILICPNHLNSKIEKTINHNIDSILWNIINGLLEKNPLNRWKLTRAFDIINSI